MLVGRVVDRPGRPGKSPARPGYELLFHILVPEISKNYITYNFIIAIKNIREDFDHIKKYNQINFSNLFFTNMRAPEQLTPAKIIYIENIYIILYIFF